jgi:hypothetical protein
LAAHLAADCRCPPSTKLSLAGAATPYSPRCGSNHGSAESADIGISSVNPSRYARRWDRAYCSLAFQEAFSEVLSAFTEINLCIA